MSSGLRCTVLWLLFDNVCALKLVLLISIKNKYDKCCTLNLKLNYTVPLVSFVPLLHIRKKRDSFPYIKNRLPKSYWPKNLEISVLNAFQLYLDFFFHSSVTGESFVDETGVWNQYKISIHVSRFCLFQWLFVQMTF